MTRFAADVNYRERLRVPEVIRQTDVSLSRFSHHTSTRVCVSNSRPHARTHTANYTSSISFGGRCAMVHTVVGPRPGRA